MYKKFICKHFFGHYLTVENELKKFHDVVQKFFEETPIYYKLNFPLLRDAFFAQPKTISEEAIDKQIAQYQHKIDELQDKKHHIDSENRKIRIKEEIQKKKNSIDVKLDEFVRNLDNDGLKQKFTR